MTEEHESSGEQVEQVIGRAKGGKARAESLTAQRRKEIAVAAQQAKAEIKKLPKATHGSADNPLKIGGIEIPCYVLEDGTRVLTQRGFMEGVGVSYGSSRSGDARHVVLLENDGVKPHINNDLLLVLKNPIRFQNPRGGGVAFGYPATVLADYCDAILAARRARTLPPRQSQVADKCEILVRGFARVGIIALVDEATGYQKDRAKDALAQILEAFVAKELQPYVRTFPADYYEQLFRLYGLQYPPAGNKSWRPSFFGKITNEVVYNRLAPELLPELKRLASKAERKSRLHQWLTHDIGHPKLREHLASVVTIQKLSKTPQDFMHNVNMIHPRYGDTRPLPLTDPNAED